MQISQNKWAVKLQVHQPTWPASHRISMRVYLLLLSLFVGLFVGCTNQSPDQLREKTAEETSALKRDTKAVAQGVKDGLSNKRSLDLNKAPKEDLASLPGLDERKANRIVAERPFANTHQLVTRHILTEDEYSAVQDRVVVGH